MVAVQMILIICSINETWQRNCTHEIFLDLVGNFVFGLSEKWHVGSVIE